MSEQKTTDMSQHFYRAAAADFMKIPGSPITYWLSKLLFSTFDNKKSIGEILELKAGLSTGDNTIFQRHWHEVSNKKFNNVSKNASDAKNSDSKWFPCHSGGEFRKWYGNHSIVINWKNDGIAIRSFKGSAIRNNSFYFKEGITWSKISSGQFAARYRPSGFIFDDTGRSGFSKSKENNLIALSIFCSKLSDIYLSALCPTLSFTSNEIIKIPYIPSDEKN